MMRTPLLIGALAMCLGTLAQTDSTYRNIQGPHDPNAMDHMCVMALKSDWQALGLSEDQIARVLNVQERCRKEHPGDMIAASRQKENAASFMKYQKEIEEILTPEQRTKWRNWCSDRPATGSVKSPPQQY